MVENAINPFEPLVPSRPPDICDLRLRVPSFEINKIPATLPTVVSVFLSASNPSPEVVVVRLELASSNCLAVVLVGAIPIPT